MGRHNKKTDSHIRRNSVIALTGLIPIGLVTAANTAGATPKVPFFSSEAAADVADVAQEATAAPNAEAVTPVADTAAVEATPAVEQAPAPALAPVQATPPLPASIAQGALGIPAINVSAYQNAERILAVEQPGCGMYWTLIAGIGRVESTHAYDGKADDKGNMLDAVLGPVLDGHLAGNAVIRDTDGGRLDGDSNYDRAVGPTQFLPETWNRYAGDGNGDGAADPQNLFDSALTTGKYLCDGGLDVRDPIQAAKAVHRYNNSAAYVANVLAWSAGYASGIVPAASDLPRIH
ncbi:murein transglycosylase [Rhodococcus oxybenzonivorans]|uniref:Murein transglycosylase n=1 Tax=Rhodococcus oxybenzonivorans TaxID=1990687 RepID=A0A2S2BYC5_9NOCA|nr:lytic murein transglycosylase [Rhodococcus oxybenzonivorans]AWK73651.1 murein transglycosylase [Rhodococcus oxybenzonivorans]